MLTRDRRRRLFTWAVPLALVGALSGGCGTTAVEPVAGVAPATESSPVSASPTSPVSATIPTASETAPPPIDATVETPTPSASPPAPAFTVEARSLTPEEKAAMTGVTWRRGCPVPLEDLRHVTIAYWTFDGEVRQGALVVNADVVDATTQAFRRLFEIRFPIRRMEPIEAYGGDDFASIEADNTSAFNCRNATGSTKWSMHAYGRAIDVNPLENPYVYGSGKTSHPGSVTYLDRANVRPGMVVEGSAAVAAFDAAGWGWGGRWTSPVDHQHFSMGES